MATEFTFISLACPNCGGRLEIYDDMDRFACSFCGSEILAQRRGGAVLLTRVENAIHRVQVGTDKTASELALPRLHSELQRWTQAEWALLHQPLRTPPPFKEYAGHLFFGCAAVLMVPLWVLLVESTTNWGLHDPLLRVALWVSASIILLSGMWAFFRGNRRRAEYRAQSGVALRGLEDARLKQISETRLQIDRVKAQIHENRRILDS